MLILSDFLTISNRSCSNGSILQLLENMIMPQICLHHVVTLKVVMFSLSEFQPRLMLTFV